MPRSRKALTLSLIIPAYNEQDHIAACLDLISQQTVMPDEVILVNNNSTDKTANVAANYKYVTVLNEKVKGITAARNSGFNKSSGSIIGRIDADTHLSPDWVEKVLDFYSQAENGNKSLTGGGWFYNIRAKKLNSWLFYLIAGRLNKFIIGHDILWGSNMALTRKQWNHVAASTCDRTDIHEDIDLAIHLNVANYKIYYMKDLMVGAKMRRIYDDRSALLEHMERWPRTFRTHGYKLWWLGSIGNVLLWLAQPVAFIAEFFSRKILRHKAIK